MSNLLGLLLGIEDMFLEEGILPVHVRTVEKTISVDDLVPVVLGVVRVVVLLILYVVLVTAYVAFDDLAGCRECLTRLTRLLEAKWTILALRGLLTIRRLLRLLLGALIIIECLL